MDGVDDVNIATAIAGDFLCTDSAPHPCKCHRLAISPLSTKNTLLLSACCVEGMISAPDVPRSMG
eukprot:2100778-Prorocentrum_lima.AAC.1